MAWKRPATLRQRAIPMRVLNLGMSRTGTTSMCEALKMLGCQNCYHLDYDSDDCAFWTAAMEAKYEGKGTPFGKEEWDHIFANHDAISDLPAILFGPELAKAYPDAKILLTVREAESWHKSMLHTVCNPVYRTWYHRMPAVFLKKERRLCQMSDKCEEIAWQSDFEKHGRAYYASHNAMVRGLIDSVSDNEKELSDRRFLEWQLGEGWTRLAPFLQHKVPVEPYPRGNNVDEFTVESNAHTRHMWLEVVKLTMPWTVLAVASALWLY